MTQPKRSIFRPSAIQHYIESQEKDVLPRFVAPPVFAFLWSITELLAIALLFAWWTRVPTYSVGTGVIASKGGQSSEEVAIAFFPPEQLPNLQPGQSINLRVGKTGQSLQQTIESVEPEILSPSTARQRYSLDPAVLLAITEPSAVVTVKLAGNNLESGNYEGSIFSAQAEVGSKRIISLLPIFER